MCNTEKDFTYENADEILRKRHKVSGILIIIRNLSRVEGEIYTTYFAENKEHILLSIKPFLPHRNN